MEKWGDEALTEKIIGACINVQAEGSDAAGGAGMADEGGMTEGPGMDDPGMDAPDMNDAPGGMN